MNTYGNTNNRKVRNGGSLALLLIALLLVSCVGVAYAYSALTSEQEIDNNTLDDEYIVLKTNSEDVLDTIAFDTVTDGTNVTKYKVHLGTDAETITLNGTPTEMLKISIPSWKVNVTKTNVSNTESVTYGLNVTVTKFIPVAGLNYVMVINNVAVAYNSGWTFTGLSYDQPNDGYTVALYVFGETTNSPLNGCGFTNYSADPSEVGSVFKFVATAEPVA